MNNYAKLIDGRLRYAPTAIRTDEGLVCNPRPDKLISLGYKEVVCDEQPEPSDPPKHYREVYTEEDDASGSAGRNTRPNRNRRRIPNNSERPPTVPRRTNT